MKLKSLHIYENYGDKGYRVSADFADIGSEVKLALPATLGNAIVNLCMSEILASIQSAATITAESLLRGPEQAAKEIEHHAGD